MQKLFLISRIYQFFHLKKKNPTIIANTGAVFPKIDVKEPEIVFNDRNQQ